MGFLCKVAVTVSPTISVGYYKLSCFYEILGYFVCDPSACLTSGLKDHTISCDITWNTKNIGVNEGKNQLYLYLGTPPSPCWVWLLWSLLSGYEMPLQEGLHFEKRMFHSTFALVSPLLSYRTDGFHSITEANSNGQWNEKLSRWINRMNFFILGGCTVKFPHFRLQTSLTKYQWK